ncbi:GntR family transcriptional regulator [Actinomadura sp. 7K507]|uniref:GntR family transcriptional regulator n=1 Tax=Actinomadura sp. 7K507 TaxID=2530365 RepID=UPI001052F723|nr:GntR family transcriptional regulator [Actinomadura sp. 7K507]TDC96023.1 GntR family transcriptional regulator [Actinomadura sp. 7K507]
MASGAGDYLSDLDSEDPRSPSKQIADQLRAAITSGRLRPLAKLPSQKQLSERYGVARETVKAALRQLAAEGLIESRQGSGSFVSARGSTAVPGGSAVPDRSASRAFGAALESLEEAQERAASVIRAMPEPQQAFEYSTELADKLRLLAEDAADLRAQTAVRIAEHEKLTLTVLAKRISTSRARAGQLVQRGKKQRHAPKNPEEG